MLDAIRSGLLPGPWARAAAGLLLAGLGGPHIGRAQDLIVRSDSTRIEARVLGVAAGAVSYRNWAEPDGPITRLSTDYVRSIRYQNGIRQEFGAPAPAKAPRPAKPVNMGRDVLGLRPLDLLLINATLTYEHLFGAQRRVGVKVPLTLKLVDAPAETYHSWGYYQSNKFFGTGLELNFYVGPPARCRYFWGPAVQYGQFRYRSGEQYLGNFDLFGVDLGPVYRYQEAVGEHLALLFNNGVRYQVGKRFVCTGEGGIGWQTQVLDKNHKNLGNEELAGSDFKMALNLGFAYQF